MAVQTAKGTVVFRQVAPDFTRFKEINFQTPFELLTNIIRATGGYIYQGAAVSTPKTHAGQPLTMGEMWMPGGPVEPLPPIKEKISISATGLTDSRRLDDPFTFIVGDWHGEIKLPEAA